MRTEGVPALPQRSGRPQPITWPFPLHPEGTTGTGMRIPGRTFCVTEGPDKRKGCAGLQGGQCLRSRLRMGERRTLG